MLYYNPNVRRKITYKIPVNLGEEQQEKKELYSYSVYTQDYKEKKILFNERKIHIYRYKPEENFMDSLEVYNDRNEMTIRYYFDIIDKDQSNIVYRKDLLILEFKESYFTRNRNVCHGYLEYDVNQPDYLKLSFHRVDSFLGYRVKVKLLRNKEGDFAREEFYNSHTNCLEYVLENKYEYHETDLERRAQRIFKDGWQTELQK